MWIHTYTFRNDKVNHSRPFHLTLLHPFFSTLFLSFLHAFSHVALSFTLSCIQLLSFRPYSHPRTLFRLSHSRFLPPFFLTPIRSPFLFPFSYRFFFILGTIQIPSIMLELQKPGQSAATSEAPGIAARYDSANTTTTRPLHESNS